MKPDVVVVGGGIIGLSTAYRLAQQKVRVCVIDRGPLGAEASWAAGGILTPIHLADYPAPLVELCRRSVELYPRFVEEVRDASGVDPEFMASGVLFLVLDDHDEREAKKLEAWKRKHGRPVQALSAADVRKTEPMVSNRVRRALLLPDITQVRNNRLVRGVGLGLRARSVDVREHTPCTEVVVRRGRAMGVRTLEGVISCGQVLLATGAWAADQASRLGRPIAVRPVKGQMLLTEAAPGFVRHILINKDQYVIPRRDGKLLVGATVEEAGFDKRVTLEGAAFLARRGAEMVPKLSASSVLRLWAGLRPGSIDRLPFMGSIPDTRNVFVASGHFRNGILLAPVTAELMATLLLGRRPVLDLAPFRLDR